MHQTLTNMQINPKTLNLLAKYCSEFLIHAVDKEGKQSGIDERLVKIIANNSPIKSIYAGGITSLEDLFLLNKHSKGNIDFTVGSALDIFGGKTIKYKYIAKKYS